MLPGRRYVAGIDVEDGALFCVQHEAGTERFINPDGDAAETGAVWCYCHSVPRGSRMRYGTRAPSTANTPQSPTVQPTFYPTDGDFRTPELAQSGVEHWPTRGKDLARDMLAIT